MRTSSKFDLLVVVLIFQSSKSINLLNPPPNNKKKKPSKPYFRRSLGGSLGGVTVPLLIRPIMGVYYL